MLKKTLYYSIVLLVIAIAGNAQENQKSVLKTGRFNLVPVESFKHMDIGNPAIFGTVKVAVNGIDITAGGADIWGIKDEFTFVYVERNGDFDFASRIESLSVTHLYTKAGVMAREDLSAGCRHIYFQVFPNNNLRNKNNGGYEFQYRKEAGGEMKAIYPSSFQESPEFPVSFPDTWIRLQRVKNDFIGYYSNDGENWKVYTTFQLALPQKVYLGLAVTSHNTTESATAKFRNTGELKH